MDPKMCAIALIFANASKITKLEASQVYSKAQQQCEYYLFTLLLSFRIHAVFMHT